MSDQVDLSENRQVPESDNDQAFDGWSPLSFGFLKSWAAISGILGVILYGLGWLFFSRFYADFGLTPEDVGVTFATLVVRVAAILVMILTIAAMTGVLLFGAMIWIVGWRRQTRKTVLGWLILIAGAGVVLNLVLEGLSAVGLPGGFLLELIPSYDDQGLNVALALDGVAIGFWLGVGLFAVGLARGKIRVREPLQADALTDTQAEERQKSIWPYLRRLFKFVRKIWRWLVYRVGPESARIATVTLVIVLASAVAYQRAWELAQLAVEEVRAGEDFVIDPLGVRLFAVEKVQVEASEAGGTTRSLLDNCVHLLGEAEGRISFYNHRDQIVVRVPAATIILFGDRQCE